MELPVVINDLQDGAPMPARADEASHPPRLVPVMKCFVHGETLQGDGTTLAAPGSEVQAPASTSAASPSPALGAHVASLYRSLVQGRAPSTRKRPKLSGASEVAPKAEPPSPPPPSAPSPRPPAPILVHGSDSESPSSSASASEASADTKPSAPADPSSSASLLYCEWCDSKVPADATDEHLRSTVHRFNLQYRPARGHYYLNESNVGYRMLKDMRWTEEEGLGAHGQGRLEPIKTRLKNDRVGLGAPAQQPLRVTHAAAEAEAAAKAKAERRRRRVVKEEKRRGRAGKGRREQREAAAQARAQEARIRDEVYADEALLALM